MRTRIPVALALVVSTGIAGCRADDIVGTSGLEVPVNVSVDLSSLPVSGVSVEVSGPGIDVPLVANLPIVGDAATGSIRVLAGSDRRFIVRAYDLGGFETHRGEETRDVLGNGNLQLDVSLTPLVGDVDVEAKVGTYTITVNGVTTLAVGGSQQLTATVVDAHGNAVPNAQVVWGSSNPGVASISAAGVVLARVPGQTTVAANYRGFAGTTVVTVQ